MAGLLHDQVFVGLVEPVVPNSRRTEELGELPVGVAVASSVGVASAGFAPDLGKALNLVPSELDRSQFGALEVPVLIHDAVGDIVVESELHQEVLCQGPLGRFV